MVDPLSAWADKKASPLLTKTAGMWFRVSTSGRCKAPDSVCTIKATYYVNGEDGTD